jgi:hypothetical protein
MHSLDVDPDSLGFLWTVTLFNVKELAFRFICLKLDLLNLTPARHTSETRDKCGFPTRCKLTIEVVLSQRPAVR